MRFLLSFFLVASAFFSFAIPSVVADVWIDGSACDLPSGGTGRYLSGTCVSNDAYQSQSEAGSQSDTAVGLINPLGAGSNLQTFLLNILDFVIEIGAIIVVLMIVYVGFKFVAARGNDTKLTEARTALLWTLIGALILLGAKVIAVGIQATVQALSVGS